MSTRILSHPVTGLLPYLGKRIALRLQHGKPDVQVKISGVDLRLDLRDIEQKYFAADCVKEPENLMIYQALAQSGLATIYVDVGANCGHVAGSIVGDYEKLILVEPNPKLANLLRQLFGKRKNVSIVECAIVDEKSVGTLTLKVPVGSSGLASLGKTELVKDVQAFDYHNVKAVTLEQATKSADLSKAYVKIDVEGFELKVIQSASQLFKKWRPIVGFEALSRDAAIECAALFEDCAFFHARFGFMHPSGSLRQSAFGIVGSLFSGAGLEVLHEADMRLTETGNFSQLMAVPREKTEAFTQALKVWSSGNPPLDIARMRTWTAFSTGR